MELNELIVDKNREMQWRETARWIKFEEDVEEETDRWGKPHVASLSFRSLLELRRTLSHGRRLGRGGPSARPHGGEALADGVLPWVAEGAEGAPRGASPSPSSSQD